MLRNGLTGRNCQAGQSTSLEALVRLSGGSCPALLLSLCPGSCQWLMLGHLPESVSGALKSLICAGPEVSNFLLTSPATW